VNYSTIRIFFDGMMMMMMLIHMLITFLWQRKKVLFYYALYIASVLCFLDINDHRFFFQYYTSLPDHDIRFYNFSVGTIEVICYNLYGWFAIQFMDLRKNDRIAYLLMNIFILLSALSVVIHAFHLFSEILNGDFYKYYRSINRYLLAVVSFAAIIRIMRLRGQIVTFFILGTFFYLCGTWVSVAIIQMGMDSRQPDLLYTFPLLPTQIGMIFEAICFTIGFSVLNRRTEKEKLLYQQQLVDQLLENERKQQKLRLIRDDIARDLHDEIGSDLGALFVMSEVGFKQVNTSPSEAGNTLKAIGKITKHVLSTMREIVWSLNSSQDSVESLSLRMKDSADAMFKNTVTTAHFEISDFNQISHIEPHHRRDFLLIFKEILHNVIKHAAAKNVYITLIVEGNRAILKIIDDGTGFDVLAKKNSGNGLQNLLRRSEKLMGRLNIESQPGQGTNITVTCPTYQPQPYQILQADL
jgi:signal transduction histidine kinase